MKMTVAIGECLGVLRKNLADHVTELDEAQKTWVDQTKKNLDDLRDAVDRKGLKASYNDLYRLFTSKPVDNRAEYSKMIGALELAQRSGATNVEINEEDYDQMFNDNWTWRRSSKAVNATYTVLKE